MPLIFALQHLMDPDANVGKKRKVPLRANPDLASRADVGPLLGCLIFH